MVNHVSPLDGKYYGTHVEMSGTSITVWSPLGDSPSKRQLEAWGDHLDEDELIDLKCDGHYESEHSYRLACLIAAAPELLEALEALLDAYGAPADEMTFGVPRSIATARAAIAKAKA